ncbi:hypothetical protein [Salmonella enterica]
MITIEKVRLAVEEMIAAGWIVAESEEEINIVVDGMYSVMTNAE